MVLSWFFYISFSLVGLLWLWSPALSYRNGNIIMMGYGQFDRRCIKCRRNVSILHRAMPVTSIAGQTLKKETRRQVMNAHSAEP